ncbi:hypothetical protein [Phytohabitans houttuyneae]|uniref:hypothetical protein n=1 Tax=Phytohabitans houttuyneae TaxID=1076126 RepID=UPI00156773EF|nr:hypothetical protein [Phytohabitans houttuyneae]
MREHGGMPPAEQPEPAAPDTPGVPRWRSELGRSVRPVAYTLALTELTDPLPKPARIVVILVAAVVFGGFDRLNKDTKLVRMLPNILLCVGLGVIVLAVTTPQSWNGPMAVAAVVLIACATLLTAERAAALTTLAAVGLITAGIYVISGTVRDPGTNPWPLVVVAGGGPIVMGLTMLALRRELFTRRGGFSTAKLREFGQSWGRAAALGIIGLAGGGQLAGNGHVPAAVLVLAASVSWIVAAAVFGLTSTVTTRQDNLAGAMFVVCGVSVAVLGLLAFDAHQYAVGLVAATMGIAVAGGGVSLLESTGALRALRDTYLEDRA